MNAILSVLANSPVLVSGNLPHMVLARLHAPLWWGAGLLALGLFYRIKFLAGSEKNKGEKR